MTWELISIKIQPALLGQKSSSDLSRPSKRQRVEMDGQDAFAETIKDVDPTITKAGPAEGNVCTIFDQLTVVMISS